MKTAPRELTRLISATAFLAATTLAASAQAVVLYGIVGNPNDIVRIDTETRTVTTVLTDPGIPLAAAFLNPDTIVYLNRHGSDNGGSEVRTHRISTNQNQFVARPFGAGFDGFWGSLVLEPGAASVIVGSVLSQNLERVSLASPLPPYLDMHYLGGVVTDLAMTGQGRLFASTQLGLKLEEIETAPYFGGRILNRTNIDPIGGATVAFDPFTNALWLPNTSTREFWKFDLQLNFVQAFPASLIFDADPLHSLVADGAGLLYYQRYNDIFSFDTRTGAQDYVLSVLGLTGLVPLAGVGGSQQVPEPATVVMLAVALAGLAAARRRKE